MFVDFKICHVLFVIPASKKQYIHYLINSLRGKEALKL